MRNLPLVLHIAALICCVIAAARGDSRVGWAGLACWIGSTLL